MRQTLLNELEVVERMKFDRGFISPYFITNAKTQEVELENPLILLVKKRLAIYNKFYCSKRISITKKIIAWNPISIK